MFIILIKHPTALIPGEAIAQTNQKISSLTGVSVKRLHLLIEQIRDTQLGIKSMT